MLDLLWLIPLLPLAGAALNGVAGPRAPRWLHVALGVGAPGLSMLLALGAIWQYMFAPQAMNPAPFEQVLYAWTAGPLNIDIAFLLDPLSAVMLFVVTFVGFWIHVYSAGSATGTAMRRLMRACSA